jgi:hypothetical protein
MDDFEAEVDATTAAPTIDPDEWKRHTGSTNKHNHEKQVWVALTPEEVGELRGIVYKTPEYNTPNDALRVWARWGMMIDSEKTKTSNPVVAAEIQQVYLRWEAAAKIEHINAQIERDEEIRKMIEKIMERRPSIDRVQAIRNMIMRMVDPSEKEYTDREFQKWAGEMS